MESMHELSANMPVVMKMIANPKKIEKNYTPDFVCG